MRGAAPAQFALRRATSADALCIGVLGIQVFLDTYATHGMRPSLAHEVLQLLSPDIVACRLAEPAKIFIVAEVDGHLVGFAELTAGARHDRVKASAPAELDRLYVQEPFTGRGLGSALLDESQRMASEGGASALWLTAWTGNERALAFYARRGYEHIGSTYYEFQGERYENRLFVRAL